MPDNMSNQKVLIVGAGMMAEEYAKVLTALNISFDVVGRSAAAVARFHEKTGKMPFAGGIAAFLADHSAADYDKAIIATGVESLKETTILLVNAGIRYILTEKPGAISFEELSALASAVEAAKPRIYVAYNRRFYSSVDQLKKIVQEDGGVISYNFEFSEWSHRIEPLEKAPGVKENWFFANSTHVIDTAFFLGGRPASMVSYVNGSLSWHPVAIFSGAGKSENGALFSYHANWQSPGRWAVEILTAKHRLYLKPMEKLQLQRIGSLEIEQVTIDDRLDLDFKPGLYKQTLAFLQDDQTHLVGLEEHVKNCDIYKQMLVSGTF